MIVVSVIIKAQDGGPVFYKQTRLKRNSEYFSIIKFRSMKVHKKDNEGPIASTNDNRITRFGKFIRATRIDELPQLINIFKGDMSLVGPRPLMLSVISEAIDESPDFVFRSNVKPGLTGFAQVYSRYDTPTQERLRYDLYYIRKYSFWLDIKLILLTFRVMVDKEAGLGKDSSQSLNELVLNKNRSIEEIINGYIVK